MRATDRRGFSLLESVVAMTIVSMVGVSALTLGSAQLRLAERSRRAIEIEALAESRMDYMGMLTDAELLSLPDSVARGKFDWPLDEYSWQVTSEPANEQAGVYYVTINILWPDNEYSVRTYFYRRPARVTTTG